jgi:hypothetical protein
MKILNRIAEVCSINKTIYIGPDGKRIWPDYWLEIRDDRMVLCRKSHPELPYDENIDWVDCEYALEEKEQ